MTSEKAPERIWFNCALVSDHMHTSTVQFPGATSYVPEETVAAAYLDAAERAKVHTLGLDKVRADRLVQKIVERTTSDARAALAEAERKAWQAGRDAAAEAAYQWWDDDDAQELREHLRALKKEPGA